MSNQETILTFKAGYCKYDPDQKVVTPLEQKGQVRLYRDIDFIYFTWEKRSDENNANQSPVYDKEPYILIPGDAQFVHVKKSASRCGGRIFSLKFTSSDQLEFFWMQQKNKKKNSEELSDEDSKILEVFKNLLNDDTDDEDEEEESDSAEDVPMNDVPANYDNIGGSSAVPGSNSLSDILSKVTTRKEPVIPVINLQDSLPIPLLLQHIESLSEDSPELTELISQLPTDLNLDSKNSKETLLRVVSSPQFRSTLESFSSILMDSEKLVGHLVSNELGYEYDKEGVEGFLSGIRKTQEKEEDDKDKKKE